MQNGYLNIYEALCSIASDINQPGDTRKEAQCLAKKMEKFETALLTEIWNDLLGIMNKTRLSLQNRTMTMDVVTKRCLRVSDILISTKRLLKKKIHMLTTKTHLKEKECAAHALLFLKDHQRWHS